MKEESEGALYIKQCIHIVQCVLYFTNWSYRHVRIMWMWMCMFIMCANMHWRGRNTRMIGQ